jgi:putative DNA primase/helicase
VHALGRWLVWNGRRWEFDEMGEVFRRAKGTVMSIYSEAAREPDRERRERIAVHAKHSESERSIKAMIKLAESEASIALHQEALDRDQYLLNLGNGTLELRAVELRLHKREDMITKVIPVDFVAETQAPRWADFLETVLPDPDVRAFVQRAVGYSLTGSTVEQVLFFAWGSGANGKSTFLETLRAALGDYALHTPADTLLTHRDTGIPNDVARLRGARFISAVETEEGKRLAESRVKQLTGGDKISARYMRAEWFEFEPVGKLWLATNHRPEVRGTDNAIWRRIRLIPFNVTIPESDRDPNLREKLLGELPGIVAWAVEGCRLWQRDGLQAPPVIQAAISEYRDGEDVLAAFLDECCVIDSQRLVGAMELYGRYTDWCSENGEDTLSHRRFGEQLSERGFRVEKRGTARRKHRLGLDLRESPKAPP